MKNIILISLLLLSLVSCQKYEQPPSLSLSGEYVIDKIVYLRTENNISNKDSVYTGGSVYINPNDRFPMDSIRLGFTRWHLDYSVISFAPVSTNNGKVIWSKQYFYDVYGQYGPADLGYIQFDCESSKRIFKIIDDGVESLTLKTTGLWPSSSAGHNEIVTLYLTRVGP